MGNQITLRRRPNEVRYYYLAVGLEDLHIGLSYSGLAKSNLRDPIQILYVTDVVTGTVRKVEYAEFMKWWEENYENPDATMTLGDIVREEAT